MKTIKITNLKEIINFMIKNLEDITEDKCLIEFEDSVFFVNGAMPNPQAIAQTYEYGKYKFVATTFNMHDVDIFIYYIDDNRYDEIICVSGNDINMDKLLHLLYNISTRHYVSSLKEE